MTAHRSYTTRKPCRYCNHEWADGYRENIEVEGKATEASIEYEKCPACGRVNNSTIHIAIESQHHPFYEGQPYSIHIPADSDAWGTEAGQQMWSHLFHNWLTSRQIEGKYGLKSGTVRKAVNRGYISAKKEGHDLFILESHAEDYWGQRDDEEG